MHKADLHHSDAKLQQKLEDVFALMRTRSKVNWDQEQYIKLLHSFGEPHRRLPPVIHVAGTNGKGSVIALLRSVFEAHGLCVHSYTSPHLINVNERIYVAGQLIDDVVLGQFIDDVLEQNQGAPLSFFEVMTLIAFCQFSDVPADILLLEVGFGGELDCTNVIENPALSVINRISYDHMEFLGDNISDIARAKAGVMKPGVPCVVGCQGQGKDADLIRDVFVQHSKDVGAPLYQCGYEWNLIQQDDNLYRVTFGEHFIDFPSPALVGRHQAYNAGVVVMCLNMLKHMFEVPQETIFNGFETVQWSGRLQRVFSKRYHSDMELWLDSGHNDSAGAALAEQVKVWKASGKNVHCVIGMLQGKRPDAFLSPFVCNIDSLHIVPVSKNDQSCDLTDYQSVVDSCCSDVAVHSHDSVFHALDDIACYDQTSIVLVAGSVYLVGEVLRAEGGD